MEKLLGNYAPQIYAILRIVVGFLFFCHGLQKVFGLFGGVDGAGAARRSFHCSAWRESLKLSAACW